MGKIEDRQYSPHKLTDENLSFYKSYVMACPTGGHCDEEWERDPFNNEYIPLRLLPDGTNYYVHVGQGLTDEQKKTAKVFKVCIGCFHPIGTWETKRVNDYFGHKADSLGDLLAELDDLV